MPAPKKRRPGQPRKPASEKSQTAHCSLSPQAYARLLRVFGNASAGGRVALNELSEDELIDLQQRSKSRV